MKYLGIPHCPYCKKSINIIRVWSLKKKGEYLCPRCQGVSNVYHSPLIWLLAGLCVGSGFLIYFFERFVFDNVNLMTNVRVFIPFAVFFIVSLFMVYLKKIKVTRLKKMSDGTLVDETGKTFVIKNNKLMPVERKN